jgi:hypothetical protein
MSQYLLEPVFIDEDGINSTLERFYILLPFIPKHPSGMYTMVSVTI